MTENGKLAPGVFRNVLSHGLAMAIFPLIAFFLIKAIGFSGITAAVGKFQFFNIEKSFPWKSRKVIIIKHSFSGCDNCSRLPCQIRPLRDERRHQWRCRRLRKSRRKGRLIFYSRQTYS